MYHDQALIPLKALHFEEGVNITLGLPIVRTAPDHGTAFDIAGQDRADPRAMAAAIRLAAQCVAAPRRRGMSATRRAASRRHRPPRAEASKSLGQNFILDRQLLARIAAIPGSATVRRVYEVGPGPGGLTRALLDTGARSSRSSATGAACRRSPGSKPTFRRRLTLIEGDALKVDERAEAGDGAHVVANLPYNVGTALLLRWLSGDWPPWWRSLTLMFQKEVAERIVAKPDNSNTAGCRSRRNGARPRGSRCRSTARPSCRRRR